MIRWHNRKKNFLMWEYFVFLVNKNFFLMCEFFFFLVKEVLMSKRRFTCGCDDIYFVLLL